MIVYSDATVTAPNHPLIIRSKTSLATITFSGAIQTRHKLRFGRLSILLWLSYILDEERSCLQIEFNACMLKSKFRCLQNTSQSFGCWVWQLIIPLDRLTKHIPIFRHSLSKCWPDFVGKQCPEIQGIYYLMEMEVQYEQDLKFWTKVRRRTCLAPTAWSSQWAAPHPRSRRSHHHARCPSSEQKSLRLC